MKQPALTYEWKGDGKYEAESEQDAGNDTGRYLGDSKIALIVEGRGKNKETASDVSASSRIIRA